MVEKTGKIILEREYIVPLRREWLKTPDYKRAAKAVKALKKFIAKHMKVEERDLRKVRLDKYLNEEMWFRGIRRPPAKIKVLARKFDDGIVRVELVDVPQVVKFKIAREKRREEKVEKKVEERKADAEEKKEGIEEKLEEKAGEAKTEVTEEKVDEKKEEERKTDEKEKEKAVIEAGLKRAEDKHKEMKHETVMKKQPKHQFRMALQK